MSEGRTRYGTLDGLRGIAALAVVVGHCSLVLGTHFRPGNSALAVDFFFMLSGFVLFCAYGQRLALPNSFKPYLISRFIRLHPLIVLSTALAALFVYLKDDIPTSRLWLLTIEGMLSMPALPPSGFETPIMPINPPTWSLIFEYIASVALGIGLWRSRFTVLITGLSGAALVFGLWVVGSIDAGYNYRTLPFGFVRLFYSFGIGTIIANSSLREFVPKLPLTVLGALLALCLAVNGSRLYAMCCLFIVFPIILMTGSSLVKEKRNTFAYWSGEISYPLYLLHFPTILCVLFLAKILHFRLDGWGVFIVVVLGSITVALISLVFFDLPVRIFLTERYHARRRQPPVKNKSFP